MPQILARFSVIRAGEDLAFRAEPILPRCRGWKQPKYAAFLAAKCIECQSETVL